MLACRAGLCGATSIFDDSWKPPPESAQLEQPPASTPPGSTPAGHVAPRTWTPAPVQSEAPPRAALPDAAAIAAADKRIKGIYRMQFTRTNPADKAALAARLLVEAQRRGKDLALLYVQLNEARDLAAGGGDPQAAVEAARGMRDAFQLPPQAARDMERSALASAIATLPFTATVPAHRAAELAMQWAECDIQRGEYVAAVQAARQASAAASKSDDAGFPARVSARTAQIESIATEYEQDKAAITTLSASPADATANLAAGRFYTFYLDDPQAGLPLLGKGLDPVLRSLAARDLSAAASSGAGLLAVAEAWADATRTPPASDPRVKDFMQRRAIFWYDRAGAAPQARDLRARRAVPGIGGEYYRGQDFGYRVFARVDPAIDFDWAGNSPEPLIAGENFSIRWAGFVKARPGRYVLTAVHNDGVRVWLDGRLVIDKWGAKVGRDVAPVVLTGTAQELKIEYTQHTGGSYLGLGWIAPGATRAVPVPAESLFHDPAPAGPVYADLTRPAPDGKIDLAAAAAVSHGGIRFVQAGAAAAHLDHWADAEDSASWDFEAPADGEYDVDIVYSCDDPSAGGTYNVSVGNNILAGPVKTTGGWTAFHPTRAGRVRLAAGLQTMQVKSTKMPHSPLWHLSEITLTPARSGG